MSAIAIRADMSFMEKLNPHMSCSIHTVQNMLHIHWLPLPVIVPAPHSAIVEFVFPREALHADTPANSVRKTIESISQRFYPSTCPLDMLKIRIPEGLQIANDIHLEGLVVKQTGRIVMFVLTAYG